MQYAKRKMQNRGVTVYYDSDIIKRMESMQVEILKSESSVC
jgi:hypothetical protein